MAVAGPSGEAVEATLGGLLQSSNILQSFVVSDEAAAAQAFGARAVSS